MIEVESGRETYLRIIRGAEGRNPSGPKLCPVTTQRSLVLLCCSTSSVVTMRVMVDLWQLSMPIAGVKLVATRGRKKILNGVAAQLQWLQKG